MKQSNFFIRVPFEGNGGYATWGAKIITPSPVSENQFVYKPITFHRAIAYKRHYPREWACLQNGNYKMVDYHIIGDIDFFHQWCEVMYPVKDGEFD